MPIGFIGAGKVGVTLGKYFVSRGAAVTGYYSRNSATAMDAAAFTGTSYYPYMVDVIKKSKLLFLTVSDSAIAEVWDDIITASSLNRAVQNKIVCHCSGALTFPELYSVHPFLAISSKADSYKKMPFAFFTIEGGEKYRNYLKNFIEQMGNQAHIIASEQKVRYHAAACFMSNHVAALVHTGSNMLRACGFGEELIATARKTLFLNHCADIAEYGTTDTLVGPVARNDIATLEKHLGCLDESQRRLYIAVTEHLFEIARERNTV
jgi:predicted short-subunit dehydrogenase-like oxidoreductase (DUF2520 family)